MADKEFDLIDDGTMDTVLRCKGCGEELRYTSAILYGPEEGGPVDRLDEALEMASTEHECPADAIEAATIRQELAEPEPSDGLIVDPAIVGLTPFFADLEEAYNTAAPYSAKVMRLSEVE